MKEAQICEIVEGLVHHLLTNKVDGLTDIYSIGLSCVVKGVPSTMGATLAQRLAPRLLDGITTVTVIHQKHPETIQKCNLLFVKDTFSWKNLLKRYQLLFKHVVN